MKLVEPPEPVPEPTPQPASSQASLLSDRWFLIALVLCMALGVGVRVAPWTSFKFMGYDTSLYRENIQAIEQDGLAGYPELCERFLEDQERPESVTKLPPTRFLYVLCGWMWKRAQFGDAPPPEPFVSANDPTHQSLHHVSTLFSVFLLLASGAFTWRMLGPKFGVGVTALMACEPMLIHMAQLALIDGFFAFWATMCLWLLWENLQRPHHRGLLVGYGACLALMVMTKENSFFVFSALCAVIAINRWASFGKATKELVLMTLVGPFVGVVALVILAGGVENFVDIYRLLVSKAQSMIFAIMTGDGPWYRYLVDILLATPLVLCLAVGGLFTSVRESRPLLYLSAFIGFTYLIMCNVRFGMNLRYATIWELPMCALATAQVLRIAHTFGRRETLVAALMIAGLCAYSLRQYVIFFIDHSMHEVITRDLLLHVKILK